MTFLALIFSCIAAYLAFGAYENKNKKESITYSVLAVIGLIFSVYFGIEGLKEAEIKQKILAEKRLKIAEEDKIPKVFSKTEDGCTVYKFKDNGYNHYFARCENSSTKNVTF